ncbi:MAG: VPDSG-CTERM sorting domain-containing protein [Verrucomicrobia bacterium]|nr:MAG: VPDSG-CTERM sorting domain-containing protein [Verrucomicrobiota bacterium]
MRKTVLKAVLSATIFAFVATVSHAGSAIWDLNPGSGDWNTAANWTPMTVPNASTDTATFGLSNTTNVSISANTEVNGITFTPAATNPYTITASAAFTLRITGTGITNNSGRTQHFISPVGANGEFGLIVFSNSATAGNSTMFTNNGAFLNGEVRGGTRFLDTSSAGNGTFINNGGFTEFSDSSTAGNGSFTNNGGTVSGAGGGQTIFQQTSIADSATLIANGGTGGGQGGQILFEDASTGGTSRVEVFGNGNLDISSHNAPGVAVGSIEGSGNAFLGGNNLSVGTNNLSTTFSGVIQDGGRSGGVGGSLTKIGTGTLILSGANTYTGNTNINRGVLRVDGSITSDTSVHYTGTLAGTGMIHGNVMNNDFGIVRPGGALGTPGVLTVVQNYTQTQYATLMIQITGGNAGQFSVLDVMGNANLNGYLDPVLLSGFVPNIGDSFIFLNYASLTGGFSHIKHQVFDNGLLQWSVIYQNNSAILTVVPNTIPDQGSTLLLLTLGLLALVTYRRQLSTGIGCARRRKCPLIRK